MKMFNTTKTSVKLAMGAALLALAVAAPTVAQRSNQKKPNIVVIWGDDIGESNISARGSGRRSTTRWRR